MMKVEYEKETDSLYITLAGAIRPAGAAATTEVAPGIMLDLDDQGRPVGIEILRAAAVGVDLTRFDAEGIDVEPAAAARLAALGKTQGELTAPRRRR